MNNPISSDWDQGTILITGGLGFIGSALIHALNSFRNTSSIDNIIISDNFRKNEKWKNVRNLNFLEVIPPNKLFDYLDEIDKNKLKKITTIFHLGACSDTQEADMDFLYENNFFFSKRLFHYALNNQINFIYASSAATYGSEEKEFSEFARLNTLSPINKYGYSKHLFDKWVGKNLDLWLESIRKKPHVLAGVKFFNVFGPNEYHKGSMASVVYHGYNQIKHSGQVKLFKSYRDSIIDGEQKRDFIYVKHACQGLISLASRLELNQENLLRDNRFIYNLGSTEARSFNELAKTIFNALGLPPKIEYIEMPQPLQSRYQYFTKASLSWVKSNYPLDLISGEDYLKETVADYVLNYLEKENPYLAL